MTRVKQKIDAQSRSEMQKRIRKRKVRSEARAVALKISYPICKEKNEGEDTKSTRCDEDIPSPPRQISPPRTRLDVDPATKEAYVGPVTRSRAKQVQQQVQLEVNALLTDFICDNNENFIPTSVWDQL